MKTTAGEANYALERAQNDVDWLDKQMDVGHVTIHKTAFEEFDGIVKRMRDRAAFDSRDWENQKLVDASVFYTKQCIYLERAIERLMR